MRRIEVEEQESTSGGTLATVLIGAVAGFAVGMYVAQRVGGFSGIAAKLRPRRRSGELRTEAFYEADGEGFVGEDLDLTDEDDEELVEDELDDADDDDEFEPEDGVPILEERVLEAFNNDPILSERAIDIGAIGPGDIELEGWVDDDSEAEHAVTLARGVPGVRSVANRLMVDVE